VVLRFQPQASASFLASAPAVWGPPSHKGSITFSSESYSFSMDVTSSCAPGRAK